MLRSCCLASLLAFSFLTAFAQRECEQDHRSNKTSGLIITEFSIFGTHSLSSSDLSRLTGKLIGDCLDENEEELAEHLRARFQDEGYFQVEVTNLRVKLNDPLAVPKPAIVEAEVVEGRRFTVGEIRFAGNHAFDSSELRAKFALKKGDLFSRAKIGSGLEGVRCLCPSQGFIDFTAIPDVEQSNAAVLLIVTVEEGAIPDGKARNLRPERSGREIARSMGNPRRGAVFDSSYVEKYIDRHREQLPPDFNGQSVQVVRNCRESSVEVRMPLDALDARSLARPSDIDCETVDGSRQSRP